MATTFQIEREIEECDERLYLAEPVHQGIQGYRNLEEEDARRYREQGFLVVKRAYTPEQAERAREELDAMTRMDEPQCTSVHYEFGIWPLVEALGFPKLPSVEVALSEEERAKLRGLLLSLEAEKRGRLVRKFVGFTKLHPPLGELAHDKPLMEALEKLMGEPAKLYVSQAMIKPPGGREKPWHQDHAYFNYPLDTPIVGVWIALDEATADNGCMRVLPGGHLAGPRLHWKRRDWQICDTDMLGQPIVAVPLDPGDALLFDGKLPHGTPANRTQEMRWAVQYHYVPARAEMIDEAIRLAAFGAEGKNVSC